MGNLKETFNKYKPRIIDAAIALGLVAVILVFIKPVIVSGDSMLPNLEDRNYLILSRQSYNFGKPERGEIVVFPVEQDGGKLYIKRVIGLPGDKIRIADGQVYVNGKKEDQSFTNEHFTPGDVKDETVPAGKLFVMGDNRAHSQDSRSEIVGFLDIDDVIGVVKLRLWPISKFGTLEQYK